MMADGSSDIASSMAYQYRPFRNSSKETRLVLLPLRSNSNDSGPLNCSIETTSLERKSTDYHAISYTWGDASVRSRLSIDGQYTSVPINTVSALRSVQRFLSARSQWLEEQPARVWIDAVSINQADHVERAHQVTLMHEIYSQASEVFICLGNDLPNEPSTAAVNGVHAIFEACMQQFDGGAFPPRKFLGASSDIYDWKAIGSLFTSPWFGRVWTVQEAAVARRATCLFGIAALPLYEVLTVAHALSHKRYAAPPLYLQDFRHGLELATSRMHFNSTRYRRGREKPKLADVVAQAARYGATDPRDIVYSVMGLVDASWSNALRVNYRNSVEETYARMTVHCMQEDRSTRALQMAAVGARGKEGTAFPSWTMTLQEPEPDAPHPAPLRPQFRVASNEKRDWAKLHEVPSASGWRTLRMRGLVYGTVRGVVPLRVLPSLDDPEFLRKIDVIRTLVAESYAERESSGEMMEDDDEDYEDEIDWEDDDDDEYHDGDTDDDDGSRSEQYDLQGYSSDAWDEQKESSEDKLEHATGGASRNDEQTSDDFLPDSEASVVSSNSSSQPPSPSPFPTTAVQAPDSPPLHSKPHTAFRIASGLARTFAAGLYAPSTQDRTHLASCLGPLMQHGYNASWPFKKRDIVEKPLMFAFEGTRKMDRAFFFLGNGAFGLCPLGTRVGDSVVVFVDGKTAFVLREEDGQGGEEGKEEEKGEGGETWGLIGDAHVEGITKNKDTRDVVQDSTALLLSNIPLRFFDLIQFRPSTHTNIRECAALEFTLLITMPRISPRACLSAMEIHTASRHKSFAAQCNTFADLGRQNTVYLEADVSKYNKASS